MKQKARILPSLALTAALLLGQLALPPSVQAGALSSPRITAWDETQPAASAVITVSSDELYFGMGTAVLTVTFPDPAVQPDTSGVTWSMKPPASGTNQLSISAGGVLTIPAAGSAPLTETVVAAYTPQGGTEQTVSRTLTVKKKPAAGDFTFTPQAAVYDGQPHTVSVSLGGTAVPASSVSYHLKSSGARVDTPVGAGQYTVKVNAPATDAYASVSDLKIGEFAVTPKPLPATLSVSGVSYSMGETPGGSFPVLVDGNSLTLTCDVSQIDTSVSGGYTKQLPITGVSNPNYAANGVTLKVEYTVRTAEKTVTGITVKTAPKLDYRVGEKLDLSALTVTLSYSDSTYRDVAFADFAENGLNASPADGTELQEGNDRKSVLISHTGGKSAVTDALSVAPQRTASAISLDVPAAAEGGAEVAVKLTFDRKGSEKAFPAAGELTLTCDQPAGLKSALSGPDAAGVYTAVYTLPDKNATAKFTAKFAGNDSFEPAAEAVRTVTVTAKKPIPVLSISSDVASKAGGGDVTLTVRVTVPAGQPYPAASELLVVNDRGWRSIPSGTNGTYNVTCTLPNKADAVTFTASFAGNAALSGAADVSCAVATVLSTVNGKEAERAIAALPTAEAAKSLSADEKAAALRQAQAVVEGIARLGSSEKNQVTDGSIEKLDGLMSALTGVFAGITVTSQYSSSSGNALANGDVSILGAAAAANVSAGNALNFRVEQQRASGREALKVNLALRKGSTSVTLQTPVRVGIRLPRSFAYRSDYILRHGTKKIEDFSITSSAGGYLLSFRADSFSTFTLVRPNSSPVTDWGGGGAEEVFDEFTITAKAGAGGTISPSGSVRVERGDDKTFTIKAKSGYQLEKVVVDGNKQVKLKDGKYTFESVDQPYTIEAIFRKTKADTSSIPPASSAPPKASSTVTVPQHTSSAPVWPPVSSSRPASSERESEPESSEESSSEPSSSQESLPEEPPSSVESNPPDQPVSGGGMSDADLTVAVVIIVVVIVLSLAAVFFGIYLSRKRDYEDDGDGDDDQVE